jgi:hypothetical protein
VGGSEQGHDATSTHAATMKNVFFFVGGFQRVLETIGLVTFGLSLRSIKLPGSESRWLIGMSLSVGPLKGGGARVEEYFCRFCAWSD